MFRVKIARPLRQALLGVLCCLVTCSWAAAQQTSVSDDGSANATEAYAAKLEEWKTVLKTMRELQLDYVEADDAAQKILADRWQRLLAEGRQLIRDLQIVGVAAYAEAPGQDRELERFLAKILADSLGNDRFEEAIELATSLIENGCEIRGIYDAAGVAAFVVNDYEAAEEYLTMAEQRGTLDLGRSYKALLSEYKEYWTEEQALRKKEAEADDLPRVRLATSKGDIVVELYENEAPNTVGNFISLVEKSFYDGLSFHRVLPGFVAQGGCPLGTGQGGPGYNIYCECYEPNHRKHFRGSLSMAKAQPRDTGGSQFFLTFVPTAHLNGQHTVFGRIIEGLDVLADITRVDPDDKNKSNPDWIEQATVIRKRDHEYRPVKVN